MEVLMSIVILRWVTDVSTVRSTMYDMILDAIKRVSISASMICISFMFSRILLLDVL